MSHVFDASRFQAWDRWENTNSAATMKAFGLKVCSSGEPICNNAGDLAYYSFMFVVDPLNSPQGHVDVELDILGMVDTVH